MCRVMPGCRRSGLSIGLPVVIPGSMSCTHDLAPPPAGALLRWYDRSRRTMPWRALPGQTPDPYRVWLSEIMLQQTTVAAVIPYFERFLVRFPTVAALAASPSEAVMEAWAGLGYYARARNLHACARAVAASGGWFPTGINGLRALPGVGPYTAAAIASIAFGQPVVPVDGNIERVTARIFAVHDQLPAAKAIISTLAQRLGDDPAARDRPADFTQALFDLGATICTPRNPACTICPWRAACRARAEGAPERLPQKAKRPPRPLRYGVQFWLQDETGGVLLRRRPSTGLLGGMLELPGVAWQAEPWAMSAALDLAPQPAQWRLAGRVSHGFTHFEARLDVYAARVRRIEAVGECWAEAALEGAALPRLMRKCVELAQFTLC